VVAISGAACTRRAKPVEARDDWFRFEPGPDPFAASPIDLRELNEARAGDGGFIQARGDHFVHEKTGEPVRFWAVDVGLATLALDDAGLARLARFLAKYGVNMVRFHGPLWKGDGPVWKSDDIEAVDAARLARLHALVAALARQGVYFELSDFFPLWLHPTDGPGFEGYDGTRPPFALPFFSAAFQRLQKGWWRAALTAPNPRTGVPLARDPALGFVEILNEDSLFFWTFEPYKSVPAPQMQLLERRFGDWLRKRDGALDATFARWGGDRVRGDDAAGGRAGFRPLADLLARRDARARDTLAFMTELQRAYFDDMNRFLKQELGFRGSVTGSNWLTADARALGPLDKWSNAGCDFMDRHGYFGGPHEGARAAYAISNGDRYDDALALRFESDKPGARTFALPVMDLAYNGKPSTVSEINWVPPNRYRAELPVLAAAYGALQGTDGFFFFRGGENAWAPQLTKFTITDPAGLGQFPAAALLYRRGLVQQADVVVHLEADVPSLAAGQRLPLAAPANLDALRAGGVLPQRTPSPMLHGPGEGKEIDPLAFLVGRVEVDVRAAAPPRAGDAAKAVDLTRFIDHRAMKVRSATGELAWDWGQGLVTIDAPAAQGATGLLRAAGPVALADVTIASDDEYGSVLVVALDGAPLARSRRMLLQVMTEDQNSGFSAPGQGLRAIVDVGGPPLVVRKLAGRVTFKGDLARPLAATALDFNGYATSRYVEISPAHALVLLPDVLYYLVER
jgi:hypothetical protein